MKLLFLFFLFLLLVFVFSPVLSDLVPLRLIIKSEM